MSVSFKPILSVSISVSVSVNTPLITHYSVNCCEFLQCPLFGELILQLDAISPSNLFHVKTAYP